MKKGQMEIIGLAIVIIIILIGLAIAVRFMTFKNPENTRAGFVSAELASNTINTFLETTAENCLKSKMKDLIQDCAEGTERICGNGQGACAFVRSAADEIFTKTFRKWKTNYKFLIYSDPNHPFVNLESGCAASQEKVSDTFFIPVTAATVYVKLDICK
ncbi:hypothetical protein HYX06_05845 [Candidatus Woesearchaeota archaeon]|nr:hypothetical protein [Candidatus Woesearchaeota archaeon]